MILQNYANGVSAIREVWVMSYVYQYTPVIVRPTIGLLRAEVTERPSTGRRRWPEC
jgi:hypothetical protein